MDDYYIVQDDFLVGLRLGGGIVARGEATYYRRYTLLQPAGTEREGRYADNTILKVLLPFQLSAEELPEDFVLIRDSYLDGRIRVITDDLWKGLVLPGVEARLARARLSRSALSRKGGNLRAYRDRSAFNEQALRAFLRVFIFRIPLASAEARQGRLGGDFYAFPASSPVRG